MLYACIPGAAECDFDVCKNVLRSILRLRATSGGQLNANRLIIHMHDTDTSIQLEESMVPDKEDAVQTHVSDMSTLPSGLLFPLRGLRHPIISEYEVSVFRDVEAAFTAAADSL